MEDGVRRQHWRDKRTTEGTTGCGIAERNGVASRENLGIIYFNIDDVVVIRSAGLR